MLMMGTKNSLLVESTAGQLMVRRAISGDRAGSGREAARTCEDAMRTEFWD